MKILIADDQPHLGRLLEALLRPWGYEPMVVHDGVSALEALRAPDGPRLALLDWLMPGLDGIEVCRRLRGDADRPYAYTVLMTGLGTRAQMLEGLEAGADDFLAKPVDEAELRARLTAGRRILSLQEQLLAAKERLWEKATRDGLTGLWNRSAILELLDRELARGRREGGPVGVVLADLDHFKRINDGRGHQAGDEVLRQAARRMAEVIRPYDTLGRYGGEEFLIVLPGCDRDAALMLADRLRQSVAAEPVALPGGPLFATMSLGVTAWERDRGGSADELLREADTALYAAKRAGRDRALAAERG